jgi:hypothetical protein
VWPVCGADVAGEKGGVGARNVWEIVRKWVKNGVNVRK